MRHFRWIRYVWSMMRLGKGMQSLQLSPGLSALAWVKESEHKVGSGIMISVHFYQLPVKTRPQQTAGG